MLELKRAGRDKSKIRTGLRHILLQLELTTDPLDEWTPEYREWLLFTFKQALDLAKEDCVKSEEYEQAAEIQLLIPDVMPSDECSILDP